MAQYKLFILGVLALVTLPVWLPFLCLLVVSEGQGQVIVTLIEDFGREIEGMIQGDE